MSGIVWFRQDLRLGDNPALVEAVASGAPVIPLFILDPDAPLGAASRWWLHESLAALSDACAVLGAPLVLRRGRPADVLAALIAETGADTVYWNRLYEPQAIARDKDIKSALSGQGVTVRSFNGSMLAEPWALQTISGTPYKVFTPFWRALSGHAPFAFPLAAPQAIQGGDKNLPSDDLSSWQLQPVAPDWAAGLRAAWVPGEKSAALRLSDFLDVDVAYYKSARDFIAQDATSRLAPHLHWGEISSRQIWAVASMRANAEPAVSSGVSAFLRQIGWREFSTHLLYHWPQMVDQAWKPDYADFPWRKDEAQFRAWTQGRTGYPLVDAAMRALWSTGTMHNRARMVVASFLVKHLLIDWRRGAEWFEDTLVDADLANNRAGWQWVAGSGADASPYFRIFNPVLQGERYDPDGTFIRQWLPELAGLDNCFIHKPWDAPAQVLDDAGIVLGETYPAPLVNHDQARARALDALAEMKDQLAEV
tara:strand:+ start:1781 stop:3217 length:1437 start_codon:yes stop_codon:yes gene_type:complete